MHWWLTRAPGAGEEGGGLESQRGPPSYSEVASRSPQLLTSCYLCQAHQGSGLHHSRIQCSPRISGVFHNSENLEVVESSATFEVGFQWWTNRSLKYRSLKSQFKNALRSLLESFSNLIFWQLGQKVHLDWSFLIMFCPFLKLHVWHTCI